MSIRERLREDARKPMSSQERDEAFAQLREDVENRFDIEGELENFKL